MAALSKRAQLELQGWKFTPVPRFWREGALGYNSETGWKSQAHYDHKTPDAWIAVPPAGRQLAERRFENRSPSMAVRWAWERNNAPQPDPDLSGVVGLTALMQAARSSGVISDFREQSSPCALRPDAELISACREYLGCDRIASDMREVTADPWEDRPAFRTQMDRLSDAVRERNRLLPQVLELPAKTHEGVAMKARVIGALFADKNGLRSAAVRSLTDDIAAVIGEQRL